MRLLVVGYTRIEPVYPSGDRSVVNYDMLTLPENAPISELIDKIPKGASELRIQGIIELNEAQSVANTTRTLDEMCMDYVSQVLEENRGTPRGSIAAKLGIGERTLYRYIKKKERIAKCATSK